MKKSFRDLLVWQKSMDLVIEVYKSVRDFSKAETYGLTSQICRAASSIPANIAEGSARFSNKEFSRFINIARGSAAELETHLEICIRLEYIDKNVSKKLNADITEISKMLYGLKKSLNTENSQLVTNNNVT